MRFYFSFFLLALFLPHLCDALELEEYLQEVLQHHPKVHEASKKIQAYRLEQEKISAEYLPQIDLLSSVGVAASGRIQNSIVEQNYHFYSNVLRINQNLFNGFSTTKRYEHSHYKALASLFSYQETINTLTFNATKAYIEAIQSYRLLQVAKDALRINEKILSDVKEIYEAGMISYSEVTKTESSLALAKANFVLEKNNTHNKLSALKEFLGRELPLFELASPPADLIMPESLQRAAMLALEKNPSLKVQENEIQSAKYLYEASKSSFYPIVDATFEQYYNDRDKELVYDLPDDRSRFSLNATWNLYKGGADSTALQKSLASLGEKLATKRIYTRELIRQMEQAWNQYHATKEQLEHLYILKKYSHETLNNHIAEYKIGSKTLIDLLFAQTDLIEAQREIIGAQTKRLLAQYLILYTLGLAPEAVFDTHALEQTLQSPLDPNSFEEQLTLLLHNDYDQDGITDNLDLCPNTKAKDGVMADGCLALAKDSDFDGINDREDLCPNTRIGALVDLSGCQEAQKTSPLLLSDLSYTQTPQAYDHTSPQKKAQDGLYDYLYSLHRAKNTPSREYEKELLGGEFALVKRFEPFFIDQEIELKDLHALVSFYHAHSANGAFLTLIGHTQTLADQNMKELSLHYAQKIANALVDQGLKKESLIIEGRANLDKLYYETDAAYAQKNNRVMVALYAKKAPIIGDDDNDGVRNTLDECPDTPQGYMVDAVGCSILIDLKVLFENDSATIRHGHLKTIKEFARFLLDHPAYNTQITGHTSISKKETAAYNMQLSLKRAENVKKLLVQLGVHKSRIATQGRGQTQPIASNSTKEGQAKNRRIEASLIKGAAK